MSVIMVQEVAADPNGLEQFASANKETVQDTTRWRAFRHLLRLWLLAPVFAPS
jgi:hypothetical protein